MKHYILMCGVILLCTPVSAQVRLELSVVTGDGPAQVTLHVMNDTGLRPDVVGFNIARTEYARVSHGCNPFTVINQQILRRPFPSEEYSFELEDAGLSEGRAYYYQVWIDSPRQSSEEFDIDLAGVIVTVGRAMIAQSAVVGAPGQLLNCYGSSCTPFTNQVGVAPQAIIGDGRAYQLFGYVRPRADAFRFEWVVEAAVPSDCLLPVEPSTWVNVKSLFR